MKHPKNFIDLSGEEYENFKVIKQGNGRYTNGGHYKTTWICRCVCGKEFEVDGEKIRKGLVYSCGCMRYKNRDKYYEDLTGKKFGKLTVVRRLKPEEVKTKQYNWLCKCECGRYVSASANKLKTGIAKSCGCLKDDFSIGDITRTHGKSHSKIYNVYSGMKQRCFNPNNDRYKNYGGRGITICDEWLGENGFENFYRWAMEAGYDESKSRTEQSIDRIDVNGNYEPSNCRWADSYTQARNKQKQ